jgi:hypothetical protein
MPKRGPKFRDGSRRADRPADMALRIAERRLGGMDAVKPERPAAGARNMGLSSALRLGAARTVKSTRALLLFFSNGQIVPSFVMIRMGH